MVLDYGIDVNTLDYDLEEPPIYLAARLKFREVVEILCDKKLNEIDFDCFQNNRGKTARDLILKYRLYKDLPSANKCLHHHLYNYIRHKNTRAFINQYLHKQKNLSNDKKCSFLIRAAQMGADQIVEYMLQETECCVNEYINLLEISCKKGMYNIYDFIIESVISHVISDKVCKINRCG